MSGYGNPWDVAVSTTFRSLAGDSVDYLNNTYNTRGFSTEFRERVSFLSEEVCNGSIYRNAVGALRKLKESRKENTIRRLSTIGELQHAPSCMEGYVVANPVVRRAYNKRLCAGYENGYSKSDYWRGTGYKHTDSYWRAVMNGRIDEETMECHSYAMTKMESETLSNAEQIDVIVTWQDQIRIMRETDDDTTSTYNAVRG